jgi:hypothetical protein
MSENKPGDIQEIEKYLKNIETLQKKLKKYTYHQANLKKQDSILKKYIIAEESVQNILSSLSQKKSSFSTLETLRIKCEECEKIVEDFESNLDEEQYERYKDIKRSNFLQGSFREISSTISSSSLTNSASGIDRNSSLLTRSVSQSIKLEPLTNKRCRCLS